MLYLAIAAKDMTITAAEVSGFPLARIEAGRPLPLAEGVNPAWAGALARLQADAVAPLLGASVTTLTEAQWTALNTKLAPFETWLAGKAGAKVEKLGAERVQQILLGNGRAALAALVARVAGVAPWFHIEKLRSWNGEEGFSRAQGE